MLYIGLAIIYDVDVLRCGIVLKAYKAYKSR